jgi:predicted enzyme related to lactoylglutathione lyase
MDTNTSTNMSTTRVSEAAGSPVVWFEVIGEDTARLRAFFGELFGWQPRALDNMDYSVVDACGEGIPGGIGKAPRGPGWATFYVRVLDIRAAIERATALGGQIVMPLMRLPCGSEIAVISDPEGHPVGLAGPDPAS